MYKRFIFCLIFILSFFFIVFTLKSKSTLTTVKYFPIDKHASIEKAKTNLMIQPENREITWHVESTSVDPAYLRQDISLLYENGKFKGVQSKWRQHIDQIQLSEQFKQINSGLIQTISFHHGEFHYSNDQITSIQKMTAKQLYVTVDNSILHSFQRPRNIQEKKWQTKLNNFTNQQLKVHWKSLIKELNIPVDNYTSFPLTDLIRFEQENLPNQTVEETQKIIGQLWEGLYKNYVLLLKNQDNQQSFHYIPLILIDKDNEHLLVIFELNGKAQKLIQKIS